MAKGGRTSMITMDHTVTHHTTGTTIPTSTTSTTMQLYVTPVSNLLTLQENASTIQPTSAVVLVYVEIDMMDSSLG